MTSGTARILIVFWTIGMTVAVASPLPPATSLAAPERESVTVYAAASTTAAVEDLATAYTDTTARPVRTVFAASSALARQILAGAPADIFLSALPEWMDALVAADLIVPGTRNDLLANRLVLIAPKEAPFALDIAPGFPLSSRLGDGRLAVGDPDHVPVGVYARAALTTLGVWPTVADRLARTADALGAVALVDRGEAAAGIVYASDARLARHSIVVGTFPESSHPPIRYPIALVRGDKEVSAAAFLAFLCAPDSIGIFADHGFAVLSSAACERR